MLMRQRKASASTPAAELFELARRARRLVDAGTPPEAIAVVLRDLAQDAEALVDAFDAVGLPARARLGVPLAPHLAATNAALDALAPAAKDELVKLGLAEIEEFDVGKGMEKHMSARWTLKTTYFWEQTFPAKAELLIEHHYTPSVGATVQTSIGSKEAMQEDWFAAYRAKYCMDTSFLDAVEQARASAKSDYGGPFSEQRISYILTTGGNWAGPIGTFRLVVDKGDASSLVSFCGEGVKKIGATEFEETKSDFKPKANLNVLILKRLETP